IVLPALAIPLLLLARRHPNIREAVSLLASTTLFALVVILYRDFTAGGSAQADWIAIMPGLEVSFRVEALGVLFALVASFLWIITTLYAIGYMRAHEEDNQTRFYVFFAVSIASVMAIAFAANLFTLFIFYEMLTLATYPLVTHAGTEKARAGGRTYLTILVGTSIVFFLPAIIATYAISGTLTFTPGGVFAPDTSPALMGVLLVLFVFGIGKAAIMPFHRWLPAAMVAPTPVSSLLHAVAVVKAGGFSVIKVGALIFGLDSLGTLWSTDWLLYLAGFTVIAASLVAMRQDNLKARLAYSTVSQLSYMTAGVLLASSTGLLGSSMHIAMHAFGKITLFFCAGAILVAAHKSEISQMRGLGRQMPFTMAAFFIGSLSIIGLPPTGGTWSKWYLVTGSLDAGQWALVVILMLSSLLNIAYLLPIPLRAFVPGEAHRGNAETGTDEAPWPSLVAIGITPL
ncbi:MAG: proton-conducting transporter membrane subunit, partial [Chromatocurvus sp.]